MNTARKQLEPQKHCVAVNGGDTSNQRSRQPLRTIASDCQKPWQYLKSYVSGFRHSNAADPTALRGCVINPLAFFPENLLSS